MTSIEMEGLPPPAPELDAELALEEALELEDAEDDEAVEAVEPDDDEVEPSLALVELVVPLLDEHAANAIAARRPEKRRMRRSSHGALRSARWTVEVSATRGSGGPGRGSKARSSRGTRPPSRGRP